MRLGRALLAAALAGLALPAASLAGQPIGDGEGGAVLRQVGDFEDPVYVAGAPGFPHLLFVVEQPGRVRVLRRGATLARPFLDISDRVLSGGERGLFSIAFPPDYKTSRRFYVYYTDLTGDIQIDEYRRSGEAFASPASRRPLLTIPHSEFPNHNGGQLLFHGRELLIGTGDGGAGGDPPNNAQNRDVLLGKLLRILPTPVRSRPYTVPPSNPFVGLPGRDEIFSYGLRNPWRFSIQDVRRGPDRLLLGDVGQNRFEEVDYETLPGALGANFGWDAFEGFAPYVPGCTGGCSNAGTPDPGGTAFPIFAYSHAGGGCAVTGGYVVRSPALTSLYRRYVYADLCQGEIRSFIPRLAGAADDRPLGLSTSEVSSFGQTPDGRLFVCSLDGPVYRIAPG
jgi:glucose/arabinose dehydrogenase